MPKLLKFFLLLVATSLPLFYLWFVWGQDAYQEVIKAAIVPLAKMLDMRQLKLSYMKSQYMNLIPYLALMLATPARGWKSRLLGILAGTALLFLWHLTFSLTLNHFQLLWGPDRRFYRLYLPAISVSSAMPVIIWLIVAWEGVRELLGEIFTRHDG